MEDAQEECRYFVTYTGVKLPLNLVNAIEPESLANRNTFIRAFYDGNGALTGFDKIVYGEVEMAHRYHYHDNGGLARAEITMPDEETLILDFDEFGIQI